VAATPQLCLKKMNKELYIVKNITIRNSMVISDGRELYSDVSNPDFKSFGKDLYRKLKCNYPKFFKMDTLCKLTFLANEFITRDIDLTPYNKDKTAVVLSSSSSTLDTDTIFTTTIHAIPSPAVFVYTLPNIAIGELSIRMGWKGENLFLIDESFHPENIVDQVNMLFTASQTELCLTGWTNYLSPTDYHVSLWLISEHKNVQTRKLTSMELLNDFSV